MGALTFTKSRNVPVDSHEAGAVAHSLAHPGQSEPQLMVPAGAAQRDIGLGLTGIAELRLEQQGPRTCLHQLQPKLQLVPCAAVFPQT